jgi:hypothetical protein
MIKENNIYVNAIIKGDMVIEIDVTISNTKLNDLNNMNEVNYYNGDERSMELKSVMFIDSEITLTYKGIIPLDKYKTFKNAIMYGLVVKDKK